MVPPTRVRKWARNAGCLPAQQTKESAPKRDSSGPPVPRAHRQLLVDVSVFHLHDAGTGIQRVVRSVLAELQNRAPPGFTVCTVAAQSRTPYCYVDHPGQPNSRRVNVGPGDIFLGLDLAAHLLPRHLGQLMEWKLQGVELHFVVYDLLPLVHPAHFKAARVRHFQRWAKLIAMVADSLLCISRSVESDLQNWMSREVRLSPGQVHTHVIALGSDIPGISAVAPARQHIMEALKQLQGRNWALMVGTLEPRKCHAQVLAAFEHLWKHDNDDVLVVVGRPGWHTEQLQQRIARHPALHRHLYWFSDATDAELALFYQQAKGVLMASFAEGFGLPLVEARSHGIPVLARDIPVFREVAGAHAQYFTDDSPDALAATLHGWLASSPPKSSRSPEAHSFTWADTTDQILQSIGIPVGMKPALKVVHK